MPEIKGTHSQTGHTVGMDDAISQGFDRERSRPENAWTVGTTAMTQVEAERAAGLIEAQFPQVYAHPVNPRLFMTLHLDRWTAEAMREALQRLVQAGGDVGNMLEEFDEFLDHACPYADGEEPWPGLP